MKEHTIKIENGTAQFVYSDDLAALAAKGTTERASHVEPHPSKPGWVADMAPSRGPVLGLASEFLPPHRECDCEDCEMGVHLLTPFATRADALVAEREWLRVNRGL